MRESVLLDILPRNEYNISGCSLVCLTKFIEKRRKWAKGVCSMSGFSAKANELGGDLSQCADLGAERTEKTTAEHLYQRDAAHDRAHCQRQNRYDGVSEIAQQLKVTKPSVTVAVNKLVQKGYSRKAPARRRPRGAGNANARGQKSGGVPPPLPPAHHCGNLRGSFGRGARGASAHHDAHQFIFRRNCDFFNLFQ